MWKTPILALVAFVITPQLGYGQDTKTVLDGVSKAMGEVRVGRLSGGRERSLDYDEAQSFQDLLLCRSL
jgi:hypothetical protein